MTAFRAAYADWKLVKTRGVIQVVFEIPLADADAAYDVLGGMPNASKERWFGIAAISTKAQAPTKRDWRDLGPAQQAGIRCDEPTFAAFLKEKYFDAWWDASSDPAECVRSLCQVSSRADLATNHKARVIWKQLDDQFQAWKALEHAQH